MKQLLLLSLLGILLSSCNLLNRDAEVKLKNGAVVRAFDSDSRNYKSGDTVCIWLGNSGAWYIDRDGIMSDTLMYGREHKIGTIK